ncbi:hypothetical protein HJFPF1_01136 [Paramyrothecium foliicola]|nr:hypothetical protein HJFPF1_01136 [Paramyrothecium foliicola]
MSWHNVLLHHIFIITFAMAHSRGNESSGFDGGLPAGDNQRRAGSSKSRATVRASLACVPCRTKHLKCDGGLPACVRCRLEDRPCHYAKSRRGIRDPKKRDMMRDEEDVSSSPSATTVSELQRVSTPSPEFQDFGIQIQVTKPLPGGWCIKKDPQRSAASSSTFLLDLYYAYFHDSHPWLLPKIQMVRKLQTHPADLCFVANTIAYVGSMYTTAIDTSPLRDRAIAMACGALPSTVWTVQSLIIMAVASLGEGKDDVTRGWLERAAGIALELGLQHKSFADTEPDPVVAESYRRTYWGLYIHGCLGKVRDDASHFPLYTIPTTADLPCEEWEYQSGEIPPPISLEEYRHRVTAGSSCSSWAYAVELVRMCEESVQTLLHVSSGLLSGAVDQADRRIVAWLMQLPEWKKELVDPDGAVDMVLFHAVSQNTLPAAVNLEYCSYMKQIALAHWIRIRLQVLLRGVGLEVPLSSLPTMGPIFSTQNAPTSAFHPASSWAPGSVAVQASLSLVGLFKFALPPSKLSPTCIYGLAHVAMPLLDACLFGGANSPMLREQILLLANVMAKSGEYWPVTKHISDEIISVLSVASSPREHSAWDAMIDEIVPRDMDQQDIFIFPPPKTAVELSAWVEQHGEPLHYSSSQVNTSFRPGLQ